jgi:hypothetical protein
MWFIYLKIAVRAQQCCAPTRLPHSLENCCNVGFHKYNMSKSYKIYLDVCSLNRTLENLEQCCGVVLRSFDHHKYVELVVGG